jgi:O-antigen/teichoic acid export membrane protein
MSRLAGRLRGLGVGADTTLTVVLQTLSAISAFGLQVIILRVLSKNDAGYFSLTITYLSLASALADFGIAATVLPRLSVAGGDSPSFKAAIVLRAATVMMSWVVMNIYLVARGNHELLVYVNISYMAIFVSSRLIGIRQFIEILWRLQGRTYIVTAIALCDSLLVAGGVIVLSLSGTLSIERVLVVYAVSGIPGFALILWPLWRNGKLRRYLGRPLPRRYYRAVLAASFPVAIMVLSGQAFGQLEPLVIERFLHISDNAAFRAATAPLLGLLFLSIAVSYGLSPVVSQIHRGGRSDLGAGFLTSVAVRLLGTLALGICMGCFLFGAQIMQLFGPKYISGTPILKLYSISNGLTFLVILFDAFLLAMGARRSVLIAAIVGFVSALVLELVLVSSWAIPGLVAAKIMAQLILIAIQLRAFQPELRAGALAGLRRLALPALLLAGTLFATDSLPFEIRVPVVLVAVVGALLAGPIVTPGELQLLRRIRLS